MVCRAQEEFVCNVEKSLESWSLCRLYRFFSEWRTDDVEDPLGLRVRQFDLECQERIVVYLVCPIHSYNIPVWVFIL